MEQLLRLRDGSCLISDISPEPEGIENMLLVLLLIVLGFVTKRSSIHICIEVHGMLI